MKMRRDQGGVIDIAVRIKHETDKAYLAETGEGDIWFPKSQVELYESQSTGQILTVPYWVAKEKGLI